MHVQTGRLVLFSLLIETVLIHTQCFLVKYPRLNDRYSTLKAYLSTGKNQCSGKRWYFMFQSVVCLKPDVISSYCEKTWLRQTDLEPLFWKSSEIWLVRFKQLQAPFINVVFMSKCDETPSQLSISDTNSQNVEGSMLWIFFQIFRSLK